jgi:predicted aldo/keto reductase-like oxidoreductase
VESYIKLSGCHYSKLSEIKLAVYAQAYGNLYCRHACSLCEPHCPNNVPVNSIMRYNHYFTQSREKHAMLKYANLLAKKADICFNCKGYCETACPYGVPIHGLLIQAHRRLTLSGELHC